MIGRGGLGGIDVTGVVVGGGGGAGLKNGFTYLVF